MTPLRTVPFRPRSATALLRHVVWMPLVTCFSLACVRVPKSALHSADSGTPREAPLIVVTFNTGTASELVRTVEGEDGYGSDQANHSDRWYGNGLAWRPAITATRAWFDAFSPDIVVFQEIFWTGDCAGIPEDARAGFVCEGWDDTQPTVPEQVLGPDYQIACHLDHPDKCAAVHRKRGTFQGCADAVCLDGLAGAPIPGCGNGARVGRGIVVDSDGEPLFQVTSIHGSSGVTTEDQDCRIAQIGQVFDVLIDGQSAISPASPDLVLGDFNTDPGRFAGFDRSAAEWVARVPLDPTTASPSGLRWISPVGADAPGSYGGLADIDHVLSDVGNGDCDDILLQPDAPHPVYSPAYFDHRPVVCAIWGL